MSDSPADRPRCKFLTCKSMMVYGEAFQSDPEYQDGYADFTCLCTGQALGPDGSGASLEDCSDPERTCYREF